MNISQYLQWSSEISASTDAVTGGRVPLIMGILNVTANSFSDGGRFQTVEAATQHALNMIAEGADIIDIGGEASNPGVSPCALQLELDRVIPVIQRLREHSDVCISIDTQKPEVMQAAIAAGANVINDISALRDDRTLAIAADLGVPVCLMHMQGVPQTMQQQPYYAGDVVDEINEFFKQQIARCVAAGIARQHLVLDPGFGFGKTDAHNLHLVKRVSTFRQHGLPVLLGVSRKSTLGRILQKPVTERLYGGLSLAVFLALQGVNMIRTHDVGATKQAYQVLKAVFNVEQSLIFW